MKQLHATFFTCCVITFIYMCSMYTLSAQPTCYTIDMHIPQTSKACGLTAYYKGKPLNLCNSFCILPEKEKRLTFCYVIAEEADINVRGNSVLNLKRSANKHDIAWYDLTLSIDNPNAEPTYMWKIEEKSIDTMPVNFPDHVIFIQTHPSNIEKIEYTNKDSLGDSIIHLPTIFLKENINFSKSLHATMASIDLRTFNTPEKNAVCVPNAQTIISLPVTRAYDQ